MPLENFLARFSPTAQKYMEGAPAVTEEHQQKADELRRLLGRKYNVSPFLGGSMATGMALPGTDPDFDYGVRVTSPEKFNKLVGRLEKSQVFKGSPYDKPSTDYRVFQGEVGGTPVDLSIMYGDKGRIQREAIRGAQQTLAEDQALKDKFMLRKAIAKDLSEAAPGFLKSPAKKIYKKVKRHVDEQLGLPRFQREALPEKTAANRLARAAADLYGELKKQSPVPVIEGSEGHPLQKTGPAWYRDDVSSFYPSANLPKGEFIYSTGERFHPKDSLFLRRSVDISPEAYLSHELGHRQDAMEGGLSGRLRQGIISRNLLPGAGVLGSLGSGYLASSIKNPAFRLPVGVLAGAAVGAGSMIPTLLSEDKATNLGLEKLRTMGASEEDLQRYKTELHSGKNTYNRATLIHALAGGVSGGLASAIGSIKTAAELTEEQLSRLNRANVFGHRTHNIEPIMQSGQLLSAAQAAKRGLLKSVELSGANRGVRASTEELAGTPTKLRSEVFMTKGLLPAGEDYGRYGVLFEKRKATPSSYLNTIPQEHLHEGRWRSQLHFVVPDEEYATWQSKYPGVRILTESQVPKGKLLPEKAGVGEIAKRLISVPSLTQKREEVVL